MDVGARGLRERAEEILKQLGLKIADPASGEFPLTHAMRPPAEINCRRRERFVHGHQEISGAQDAALRTKRPTRGFAERQTHVLDRVMLIDVEVAPRNHLEVERPVPRYQL